MGRVGLVCLWPVGEVSSDRPQSNARPEGAIGRSGGNSIFYLSKASPSI